MAKILDEGPGPGTIIQYFKDEATAFNAQKKGTINVKGVLNNRISEHSLTLLANIGVPPHVIGRLNMREWLLNEKANESPYASLASANSFSVPISVRIRAILAMNRLRTSCGETCFVSARISQTP